MLEKSVPRLVGEVQATNSLGSDLQKVDDAKALAVVLEPTVVTQESVEHALPRVTEGRVAQIVGENNRLGQVLVRAECTSHGASDLRHLQGMGETVSKVVPLMANEDLRLVLEPPERGRVDDAVTIPLKRGPVRVLRLRMESAP